MRFVYLCMHFQDIIGHQNQKNVLLDSLAMQRVPHAQMFEGSDEQGVLALAIAYANAVVCGGEHDDSSARQKANGFVHPDIHFVFPTAITNEVKSKPTSDAFSTSWREFVQQQPYATLYDWSQFLGIENKQAAIHVNDALKVIQKVSLKSFEGGWRCVVIWHAEKLTTAASNKLLKSIEEPPAKTLFLLVCPDENQLLSTIRSRCQRTHFGRVSKKDIAAFLIDKGADQELAETLAAQSNGAVGKALALFKQQGNRAQYEQWFVSWVRTAFRAKGNKGVVLELTDWSQQIASEGVETQKQFLEFAIMLFRAAVMTHYELSAVAPFRETTNFKLSKFARFIHGSNILPIIDALEKSAYHLERNGNAKMIFTELSFKLTRLLHQKSI
ncbi:MAG: DNA polymerase III subunit delta' [Gammaproteobacteria bacterium]|nr:DNA polymerase III subunit delta' [Gammaproteobacteria bacterium]